LLDLVPPILELIETLLQTGGAQPLSNGVYQAVELPHYLGEFALFGLMVRVAFAWRSLLGRLASRVRWQRLGMP
jgi:hypothetical protein